MVSAEAELTPEQIQQLPVPANIAVDFVRDIQPILAAKCYDCHGTDAQEAGFRLDVRRKALEGADSGPVIIACNSVASRLIHLVAGLDEEIGPMPPEGVGEPLTPDEIGLLRAWIDAGASWPDEAAGQESPRQSLHWSLKPIARSIIPQVNQQSWIRNPIDAFVLAHLESEGVAPSPEAARETLLRRVYLDLIGLPPTPEEVSAYMADERDDSYERVVDSLLDSPHFGERWGRHWLDAARYADSDGFEKDNARPFSWRYRDWVIAATNRDLPFNHFTVQQIAGDLLTSQDPEFDDQASVATGFHRNTLVNREGGVDPEEDRVKRTIDRTNTIGSVWLALTIGCANCHTHKYDPISQKEYFGFYAFFNNLEEVDLPVGRAVTAVDLQAIGRGSASPTKASAFEDANNQLFQAVIEAESPRYTFVHVRGDFLSKGPMVAPHVLEVLPPITARDPASGPDRLDLARWLTDNDNPLTARAIANRLWAIHFGRGLVSTDADFGTQGEPPSHPELLDWLASELRDEGWTLKRMHKLIVTSATYRQSSTARPELADRDPYNTWLARQNRLRVEAEIVRDLALAASGLLSPSVGGPSVYPPQPSGVSDVTFDGGAKWRPSEGADRYRRGLYTWFQRTSPHPALIAFDAPEANLSCTRRERSNTPLQALTLLNDVAFVECAKSLAHRMITDDADGRPMSESSTAARIRYAFHLSLARDISDQELRTLSELYEDIRLTSGHISSPHATSATVTTSTQRVGATEPEPLNPADEAACFAVARAILNLDEFITRE